MSQKTAPTWHQNIPLIETADAFTLDTILADKQASLYILTRLSDTVAVVAPGRMDKLFDRLRKLGQTPKVIQG